MQAYEQGFKTGDNTRMLLSPDSEFLKYFSNPVPNGPSGSPGSPPARR
jgi:membrane protease subunit HflC